jgi:hypothetical protein
MKQRTSDPVRAANAARWAALIARQHAEQQQKRIYGSGTRTVPSPYGWLPAGHLRQPFFAHIWKQTGLPGKPPRVVAGGLTMPASLGEQPFYNRTVHLDNKVARDLLRFGIPGGRQDQALAVLLHEYAHVDQPRMQKRWQIEGGAEAWAKKNFPRIRAQYGQSWMDEDNPYVAYAPWTIAMSRHRVARDYGQFGLQPRARRVRRSRP